MAIAGTLEHPKIRRLARLRGEAPYSALGLMEAFWHWVRRSAKTGRIDPDQWEDAVDNIGLMETGESLRDSLLKVGLVDAMRGWCWVHDWHKYADEATRKALIRDGKNFANGAAPRAKNTNTPPNDDNPISGCSDKTIERPDNDPPCPDKLGVCRSTPEPVPEPVPEPAAATRAHVAREASPAAAATPPPPLDSERQEIAKLLHLAMPMGTSPPDLAIVEQVRTAMQGASLPQLAAALIQRRGRKDPVRSYGFWPGYLTAELAPGVREKFPTVEVDPRAQDQPGPAPCPRCQDSGVIGQAGGTAEQVRALVKAGCRLCECRAGTWWVQWFALQDETVDGLPVIQRAAVAV